jgi:hypothetical protein
VSGKKVFCFFPFRFSRSRSFSSVVRALPPSLSTSTSFSLSLSLSLSLSPLHHSSLDDPHRTLIRRLVGLEGDWVAPAAALEAAGGSVVGGGGSSSPSSSSSSSSSSSASLMLFPRSAPRAEVPKGHVWVEGDSPVRVAGKSGDEDETGGSSAPLVGLGGTPFFLPPQHPCDKDTSAGAPVPAALIDGVVKGVIWPVFRAGELLPRPARSGRVVRLAAVGGGGGGGGGKK